MEQFDATKLLEKGIALGEAITKPRLPYDGEITHSPSGFPMEPYILKPQGFDVVSLKHLIPQTNPLLAEAAPVIQDADSFVAYVKRFALDGTVVFANVEKGSLEAVIDYHRPKQPEFGKHRATYTPAKSIQWATWAGGSNQQMSQTDFAEFIEGNRSAICPTERPTPGVAGSLADLLEVTRTLSGKTEVDWSGGVRLKDGSTRLTYTETVKGSVSNQGLEIFDAFLIGVPIFYGGAPQPVTCQFRYRVQKSAEGGSLKLFYVIHEKKEIEQRAFELISEKIKAELGAIPVIAGSRA
jgi:uncharacterized protein YfdQ (DUF2303 family)